jgi:hypothetical protein
MVLNGILVEHDDGVIRLNSPLRSGVTALLESLRLQLMLQKRMPEAVGHAEFITCDY